MNNWNSPKNINSGETQEKPFSHQQHLEIAFQDSVMESHPLSITIVALHDMLEEWYQNTDCIVQ